MATLLYDYPKVDDKFEATLEKEVMRYLIKHNKGESITTLILGIKGEKYTERQIMNTVLRLLRRHKIALTEDLEIAPIKP